LFFQRIFNLHETILSCFCLVLRGPYGDGPGGIRCTTGPADHTVPFTQLSGGIVIVRAQVDNYPDTLNLVFDTGSGGISLDSTTAGYLKVSVVKSEKTIRGIAGIKTVDFTMDHTLKLPGLQTPHLDFHINDYELLTSVYGVRIDGIVGYSFFRRYIVRFDYDNLFIEVYSPGTYKYPTRRLPVETEFFNTAFATGGAGR
jgi:hypothetical protein